MSETHFRPWLISSSTLKHFRTLFCGLVGQVIFFSIKNSIKSWMIPILWLKPDVEGAACTCFSNIYSSALDWNFCMISSANWKKYMKFAYTSFGLENEISSMILENFSLESGWQLMWLHLELNYLQLGHSGHIIILII